jgi:hypothetical protein
MIDPYNPPHKERMLRVHLAEEYQADRDDDSCFVIAILTEENSCYEADELAGQGSGGTPSPSLCLPRRLRVVPLCRRPPPKGGVQVKKHSTLFLIGFYIGFTGVSVHDVLADGKVADELVRRGIITLTPDGTQWHFGKLSDEELTTLEDDMRQKHESVGMFRYNLQQFFNGK